MGGMRRREVLGVLGGAAVALPMVALAQQSAKLPTIGYLGPNTRSLDSQRLAAFVRRLRELGWIEDRTVTIEYRWAEGRNENLAGFAADFVSQRGPPGVRQRPADIRRRRRIPGRVRAPRLVQRLRT